MTSYVVKNQVFSKQNMPVLATTNPISRVTKNGRKRKPAIIKFYGYTKGGTEIVDEKMGKYPVKPKSSKWTAAVFSHILDIARVNAATLNDNKTTKILNNEFLISRTKLAMHLITSLLQHCHTSSNNLHHYTQQSIYDVLGVQIERPPSSPAEQKKCRTCLNEVEGFTIKRRRKMLGKVSIDV